MDIPLCPTDVLCAKILGKERQPWLVLLSNEKHFWVLIACLPIQGKAQLQGSSEDTCRAAVHAAFILGFSFAHFLYTLQEEKKKKQVQGQAAPRKQLAAAWVTHAAEKGWSVSTFSLAVVEEKDLKQAQKKCP